MPEEKDVDVGSSPAEEEIVEIINSEDNKDVDKETEVEVEPSTQEVKTEVDDGRPDRNLLWENKRKIDELTPVIQSLREKLDTLNQTATQQPQQPQYSKAQLRVFAEAAEDTAHKEWAYAEIDKIDKNERQKELQQLFEGHTKKSQVEQKRIQATNYVAQNFPSCFLKDSAGRFIGWDNSSPMTIKINEYMQNPAMVNNPDGLVAAAKMAAFDLGVGATNKLQTKVKQTTAQLKREQKKQLISGSGSPAKQVEGASKIAKLAAEYQKTKDPAIFKELARARGLIPS